MSLTSHIKIHFTVVPIAPIITSNNHIGAVIDALDRRILEWISNLARPTGALLSSPSEMEGKQGVSLHLMELVTSPPPRGVHRPPLSISLRYLITAWLEDAAQAHRLLGELMFAAMEEKEFEVEPTPPPLTLWRAVGVRPRRPLMLKVQLSKPRPERAAVRVRGKMSVRYGAMAPLHGRVFGPGRVPIMAATVTLPSFQLTARTDYSGRFLFAAVPKEPPVTEVRVNARGREVSMPVPARAGDEPILIELNDSQI